MPASPDTILRALPKTNSFTTFCEHVLVDALGWPIPDDAEEEDLTFEWSKDDLRAQGLDRYVKDAQARQLRNLVQKQPWGIFIIEFADPAVFMHGRGMTGALRQVLRGLVSSARRQSNLPSWRREDLLFICTCGWKQYAFVHFTQPDKKGRIARLASFGWSSDATRRARTVITHNLPYLAWPDEHHDHAAWRTEWSHAWDKEALTKRFYDEFAGNEKKKIRGVYQILRDDLMKHNKLDAATAGEHSLLILNRLLFLYFIQKKGWLAQDQDYLRNAFRPYEDRPKDNDFYRPKRSGSGVRSSGSLTGLFDRLSNEECTDHRFDEIPFLNGGLFEPDEVEADLQISNATFQVIFDELLDRFNFTVTEDTPLDVEVAIDPEMLGKIFECLALRQEQGLGPLAEAEGELVKQDKRKLTGSYYTPRTIVHFMCQEALKEHLRSAWKDAEPKVSDAKIDKVLGVLLEMPLADPPTEEDREDIRKLLPRPQADALRNALAAVRVVDPAVGSGAFVVGMLHEIVRLRALLDLHLDGLMKVVSMNYLHDLKKEVIEQSLFGVDIQEQAVRLCELRLWLSLVVDYELPDTGKFAKVIHRIPTLPNLSYRIVRGDSLLERLFGHAIQLDVVAHAPRAREIIRELQQEKAAFFALRDPIEKRRRELVIFEKQVRLAEILIARKRETLEDRVAEEQDLFGGERSRRSQKIEAEQRARIELWEELGEKVHEAGEEVRRLLSSKRFPAHADLHHLRQQYFETKEHPTFFWQVDFAEVFAEKGGFDIVIANPPYIRMELIKEITPHLKKLYRSAAGRADAYIYFFEKGINILCKGGVLAYISSSTFAKTGSGEALRAILRDETTLPLPAYTP